MDALTRVPLSQQAAHALMTEITGGRWELGEQLPGEMALAAELGVGRSTIREAIRQLAAGGVLTTRQGIGVFLASRTPIETWDRLAQISAITDVVQVRVAIESRAAALAALQHDDTDAEAIRRALHERNSLLGATAAELADADIRFHRQVVTAAHNPLLLTLFESLQQRLITAMTTLLKLMPVTHQDAQDHTAVVEAILASEATRAETLTRDYLLGLATSLEAST
jgi:DNA-binding FadR family transcriptional regulator